MTSTCNYAPLMKEIEMDCVPFQGTITKNGYGRDTLNGEPMSAHRKIWIELHGQIPSDHVVMHICKTKCCINPEHLLALSKHEANTMAFDLRRARREKEKEDRQRNILPAETPAKQTNTNPVCNENMQHVADEMIAIMTGKKRRY